MRHSTNARISASSAAALSLTPRSNTDWLTMGMPASMISAHAGRALSVNSLAWLACSATQVVAPSTLSAATISAVIWKPTIYLGEEPAVIVGKLGSTPHLAPQDDQLMSEHRIFRLKPALRLERRGQHGQNKPNQRDHRASLADSVTRKIRIRFSIHTGHDPSATCGYTTLSLFRLRTRIGPGK